LAAIRDSKLEQSIIFRAVTAAATGFSLIAVAVHYFVAKPTVTRLSPGPIRFDLCTFKTLAYLAAILSAAVLMLTGFYAVIVTGKALTGYLLMVHATAAPVFAASLAISALFLAGSNSLSNAPTRAALISRICFWSMLVLSLPVILSSTLSMFSIFGTEGQAFLYYLHRYSTLLLSVAAIWYVYLAACYQKQNHNKEA